MKVNGDLEAEKGVFLQCLLLYRISRKWNHLTQFYLENCD